MCTANPSKSETITFFTNGVEMPKKFSKLAVGIDIFLPEDTCVMPLSQKIVDLRLRVKLPQNLGLQIQARSSTAMRGLLIMAGLIDSDYQ